MRIGVQFQTHGVPATHIVSSAESAALSGVDGIFLWDHMVPFVGSPDDSAWETWSLLGALSPIAAQHDVELGVLVSPLSFRHPQILARAAVTIARLSGRRFVLGVGAGGFIHDDRLFGDARSTKERMNDFVSRLQELRVALNDQNRRHAAAVRLWVGGDGRKITLPAAARWADGWSGFGPPQRWMERHRLLMASSPIFDMETSVLLTPLDTLDEFDVWQTSGVDWVIRSLRPEHDGRFELAPIRRLIADNR